MELEFAVASADNSTEYTTMTTTPKALFCPTCRKVVLATNEDFPFCSDRCRIMDLARWASGDYKVSTPIQDPDLLDELARSNVHSRRNGGEAE